MLRSLLEILVALVVAFFWVTGQLDPLQKRLQEILLDAMGETKLSYGLKSMTLHHFGPSGSEPSKCPSSLTNYRELDGEEADRR